MCNNALSYLVCGKLLNGLSRTSYDILKWSLSRPSSNSCRVIGPLVQNACYRYSKTVKDSGLKPLPMYLIDLKNFFNFLILNLSGVSFQLPQKKSFTMLLKYLQLKMQCTKSILKKKVLINLLTFFFYKVRQRKLFIFPIGTQMF